MTTSPVESYGDVWWSVAGGMSQRERESQLHRNYAKWRQPCRESVRRLLDRLMSWFHLRELWAGLSPKLAAVWAQVIEILQVLRVFTVSFQRQKKNTADASTLLPLYTTQQPAPEGPLALPSYPRTLASLAPLPLYSIDAGSDELILEFPRDYDVRNARVSEERGLPEYEEALLPPDYDPIADLAPLRLNMDDMFSFCTDERCACCGATRASRSPSLPEVDLGLSGYRLFSSIFTRGWGDVSGA